jgi:drug/metabolite transporter (DMT)-like permease
MTTLAIALALGATVCWALTQVLMKTGLQCMSRVAFGMARPWIAFLFIVPYAFATGGFEFSSWALVGIACAGGALNAFLGTWMFYFSVERSSAHQAGSLANTGPFWGVVTSVLILGERPTIATFVAAALVVVGAYFLLERGRGKVTTHHVLPWLAALGAGFLWGFSAAVPAKYCLSNGMSAITYQFLMSISSGSCWLLLALPSLFRRRLSFSRRGLTYAFVTSLFGFFIGWILWLSGLELVPASFLSPIGGTTVLFTFFFSIVLLRERPSWRAVIGGAFIFGGVFLVSWLG